jgi:hypothetical protein
MVHLVKVDRVDGRFGQEEEEQWEYQSHILKEKKKPNVYK